jgi:hypothetical protein
MMFGSRCQMLVDTSSFPGWRAAGMPALGLLSAEALAEEMASRLTGPATTTTTAAMAAVRLPMRTRRPFRFTTSLVPQIEQPGCHVRLDPVPVGPTGGPYGPHANAT